MISHKYRFIFVHAGRTGGSSFERLAEIGPTADKRTQHLGNTDFPDKHASFQYYRGTYPGKFGAYFKFTLVRNPFDRLVSAWKWRTRVVKDIAPCPLREFILKRPRSSSYAVKFTLAGSTFGDSVALFDHVGRFEDLPRPYEYVCDRLGIPRQSIPHTNSTADRPYWEYYEGDAVELARNLYREDIELFGYAFGPQGSPEA